MFKSYWMADIIFEPEIETIILSAGKLNLQKKKKHCKLRTALSKPLKRMLMMQLSQMFLFKRDFCPFISLKFM